LKFLLACSREEIVLRVRPERLGRIKGIVGGTGNLLTIFGLKPDSFDEIAIALQAIVEHDLRVRALL
jgi:hypothetical protein